MGRPEHADHAILSKMVQQPRRKTLLRGPPKISDFWKDKNLDMLKQGVYIPGVTQLYLLATLPQDTFVMLFPEKDKDLYYLFQDNMVGSPSIIFHRYHEKDKTKIRQVEMTAAGRIPKPC